MKNNPRALWASLLTLGLVACSGGEGAKPAAPGATEPVQSARGSSGSTDPAERSPDSAPPVGVQPVPGTPVENLPPHEGHEPIAAVTTPVAPAATPHYTREWWVSASGNDAAGGTQEAPFRTIGKAITLAGPGEIVRVQAGTYKEAIILDASVKAGTEAAKITLQAEGRVKVLPTRGQRALVQFKRPHWIVDGFELDVQGDEQFAATFEGNVEGSVLANSDLHHGSLGGGVTTFGNAHGATIENNHIHHFSRGRSTDSHGVVVQPTSKQITIRNNDIHDNSGDSVQCLGPEGFSRLPPADGVVIENNHLYGNRENAVDIKTCFNVVIRNNRMHKFRPTSTAKGEALVVHYSARDVLVEGNEVYDSGKGISIGGNRLGPMPKGVVVQRNRVHDISTAGGGEGTGIRLENSEGTVVLNNTVTRVEGAALMLGYGTGGATRNLRLENNILEGKIAVALGEQRPGLQVASNLYDGKAAFVSGSTDVSFEEFKQVASDSSSLVGDVSLDRASFVPGAVAIDQGGDVGLDFCGSAPDIGAVESGC